MRATLAALAFAAMGAHAADRTYAVVSLVGDGVAVVEGRPGAGSPPSQRLRRFVPFDEHVFDRGALVAIDAGIHHAEPGAQVVLVPGRDGAAMTVERDALGTPRVAQAVADALRPRLPQVGATHLVIALKSRDATPIAFGERRVDTGELEGLGFYVDATRDGARDDSAPFAYFELALVDLRTGEVVAQRAVHATQPDAGKDPDAQVRALQQLFDDQVEAAATALISR